MIKSLKILESLKHTIKDWKSIDEKIESIKEEREKTILKKSVINTIDKYSDNKDLLKTYVLTKQGNINEKVNIINELLSDKNYISYKEDLDFLLNTYKEKREL